MPVSFSGLPPFIATQAANAPHYINGVDSMTTIPSAPSGTLGPRQQRRWIPAGACPGRM